MHAPLLKITLHLARTVRRQLSGMLLYNKFSWKITLV
jgi:hypothetical protein